MELETTTRTIFPKRIQSTHGFYGSKPREFVKPTNWEKQIHAG